MRTMVGTQGALAILACVCFCMACADAAAQEYTAGNKKAQTEVFQAVLETPPAAGSASLRGGAQPADARQGGMRENVTLHVENPKDGAKFYTNPVFDETGRQVGMHNYTVDTAGNVLDESFQRWDGKITGEGVYINYRSDDYRSGTKSVVGKDGKSTTYWWNAATKSYTVKNPTGGRYSREKYVKEIAAEQRRFDLQSGIIDLKTVYGDGAAGE